MLITMTVFLILVCCVLYKVRIHPEPNPDFFNIQSTNAMRGIWSIIVIMVHVPAEYGNIIQDLAGSFAYIGVTFFFMLSGYGLSLGVLRKGAIQEKFWLKRLPKLFVPQFFVNAAAAVLPWIAFGDRIAPLTFVWVARWLRWLLVCYLIFWAAHTLCGNRKRANIVIAVCVMVFSLTQYSLKNFGIVTNSIWPTEIYGFLWGVLLAVLFPQALALGKEHWLRKTVMACAAAPIFGMMYLKFKDVIFWGDYLLKIALAGAIICFLLFLNMRISIGNKALDLLGGISFELYLSHTIVMNVVERAMPNAGSGAFILTVLAGSVILAMGIHAAAGIVLGKIAIAGKRTVK